MALKSIIFYIAESFTHKVFLLLAIAILCFSSCTSYGCTVQKPCLWNMDNLQSLKKHQTENQSLVKSIIRKADDYLQKEPLSVTYRNKKFAPDNHYYESIGPYWWPDTTSHSQAYIRHDGIRNPEADTYDNVTLGTLAERVKYLSLAFYLTDDVRYSQKAIALLQVFFLDDSTLMYPNLEYGQVVPGNNDNKGRSTGLIDMYDSMLSITESIRLLNYENRLPRSFYRNIKHWFRDFLRWCNNSEIGKQAYEDKGNTSLAYAITRYNIAFFVGDKRTQSVVSKDFPAKFLQAQIDEEGKMPVELNRTNSFGYSLSNLRHIVDYCVICRNLGKDFYSENKTLIDKSIEFLSSYMEGNLDWPYTQIKPLDSYRSSLNLLRKRIRALDKDLSDKSMYVEYKKLEDLLN